MRNQILDGTTFVKNDNKRNNKLLKFLFKFQFFVCSSIAFFSLLYYFNFLHFSNSNEENSKKLIEQFNITTLYPSSDYTAKTLVGDSSFVIGVIDIPSIDITYPILSDYNDELLQLSPCRFFGPMPNEIGNLCIAGHNYHSYKFFSKLSDLAIGDVISVYDISGTKLDYNIYNKLIVDSEDFSCTNQDTNGKRELTLVTCDSNRNKRVVIKSKEIE